MAKSSINFEDNIVVLMSILFNRCFIDSRFRVLFIHLAFIPENAVREIEQLIIEMHTNQCTSSQGVFARFFLYRASRNFIESRFLVLTKLYLKYRTTEKKYKINVTNDRALINELYLFQRIIEKANKNIKKIAKENAFVYTSF